MHFWLKLGKMKYLSYIEFETMYWLPVTKALNHCIMVSTCQKYLGTLGFKSHDRAWEWEIS